MAIVLLVARVILVCVFLRAGLAKISNLAEFRLAVANYHLLPPRLVPSVAFCLPFAETAAAVLLALGIVPGLVAALIAVLLTTFAVAIAINLARGRVFDCGCGGAALRAMPQKISWSHVVTNIILALAATAIALAPPSSPAIFPGLPGAFSVPGTGTNTVPVVAAMVMCFGMVAVIRGAVTVHLLSAALADQAQAPRPPVG